MAVDTASPRTRRALLGAALGAAAATVASAVGRPQLAQANDPNDVQLGAANTSDTTTRINYNGAGTAFRTASTSGIGIHGDSQTKSGVVGTSADESGVSGTSTYSTGVSGESAHSYGVHGFTGTGAGGVLAFGQNAPGLAATSISNTAILATSSASDHASVYAVSRALSTAVVGMSHSVAVAGNSRSATGVLGTSVAKTGVVGYSGSGVPGSGLTKTGVYGNAPNGRGVVAAGGVAQLRLVPSSHPSHPASGALGDLFLDKNKCLWFCKGGTAWVRLA